MNGGKKPRGAQGEKSTGGNHWRRPPHRGAGLAVRARKIEQLLASASWEAHGEIFGFRQTDARAFSVALKVVVEPGPHWTVRAEPGLEEQIRNAVRDMVSRVEVYCQGRVYCYRCDSSECAHSVPPQPTSVFGGYAPTGLPRWQELGELLLSLRHPKLDTLYEPGTRELAAAYVDEAFLKGPQLHVFGRHSRAYNILGQVAFGFVRFPASRGEAGEHHRVAFTAQAVESCRMDGSPRLDLNVLGRLWDDSPALHALEGAHRSRILDIIAEARRGIQGAAPGTSTWRGRGPGRLHPDVSARAERVLKEMARSLERLGRQAGRRTAHVEERRVENRPTSKAMEDACAVPEERLLWDEHKGTVVVLGPRNRIHVFNRDGRHVTSLTLDGEIVQGRLRRRRWRRLSGETLEQFKTAVGRYGDPRGRASVKE